MIYVLYQAALRRKDLEMAQKAKEKLPPAKHMKTRINPASSKAAKIERDIAGYPMLYE